MLKVFHRTQHGHILPPQSQPKTWHVVMILFSTEESHALIFPYLPEFSVRKKKVMWLLSSELRQTENRKQFLEQPEPGWLGQAQESPAVLPKTLLSFQNSLQNQAGTWPWPEITPLLDLLAFPTFLRILPTSTSSITCPWMFVSTSVSRTPTLRQDFNFVAS